MRDHEQVHGWYQAGLSVGEVAERAGISRSALRFYEREGLIASDRTSANHRQFRGDVLCRVAMIRACQRVGLTIAEIRAVLADLPPDRAPGPQDWERLAGRLRSEARERIDALEQVLDDLVHNGAPLAADRPG